MDAKITKSRLNETFAYDWIKIVAIVVGIVLFWSLLYNVTGVRLTDGQRMDIVVRASYYSDEEIRNFTENLEKSGRLSYDVQNALYRVVDPNDYDDNVAAEAAMMAGEGDVMIVDDFYELDGDGNFTLDEYGYANTSDMRAYVDREVIWSIEEMLAAARNYCSKFYVDGYIGEGRKLDEDKLMAAFKERVKGDNRFRKEGSIEAGFQGEKDRIENYLIEADLLEKRLAENPSLGIKYRKNEQSITAELEGDYELGEELTYGINLYALQKATDIVRGRNKTDCRNMALCFIGFDVFNGDLLYESIATINYFIDCYGPIREV